MFVAQLLNSKDKVLQIFFQRRFTHKRSFLTGPHLALVGVKGSRGAPRSVNILFRV